MARHPSDLSAEFAERMRQERERRGWRREDLAKACADAGRPDLTRAVLTNIEHGRPNKAGERLRLVTIDEATVLAGVLGTPVRDSASEFFGPTDMEAVEIAFSRFTVEQLREAQAMLSVALRIKGGTQ